MPLSFFARALEGRVFGSGSSPLSGVRGSRVYSPDFTLQQTRHPEDTTGAFFDGEGRFHEGYRLSLIEAGVVRTPFTDRRTAALYDLPHTGAGSGPYDGVPSLGTPRLRPLPGEKCLAECLGGDPGILVSLAAGGEFTPEGKYATPVQLAFLHDGEKIMGKLPEVVIQGSDRDMFGPGFRGVTAETWPRLSGEHLMVLEMDVARG
jgi:PmbA protein